MEKVKQDWLDFFEKNQEDNWWHRKQELFKQREAHIIKISGHGHLFEKLKYSNQIIYRYLMHLSFLIKQREKYILEEQAVPFQCVWENGDITEHKREKPFKSESPDNQFALDAAALRDDAGARFSYDRRAAVQYAQRWWNSYNPNYRQFDVDCTNYVSQCMRAGGAPMRGAPDRDKGWWYQDDNWSYSWAVANAMRWYLSGSTSGLKGKEVESASELLPGDIICYDFAGDGRWDHNTIVVDKDARDMPLVNAHTENSRNRYWSYEDSTAWTPDIQYKFFRID